MRAKLSIFLMVLLAGGIFSEELSLESARQVPIHSGMAIWKAIFSNESAQYVNDTMIVEGGAFLYDFELNDDHAVTLFVAGFGSRCGPFAIFEDVDGKYVSILDGTTMNIEILSESHDGYPALRTFYYEGPCALYETVYHYSTEYKRYGVHISEREVSLCDE